jgi:hypothetical protein
MWLPTYLKEELNFDLASSGFVSTSIKNSDLLAKISFLPYALLFLICIAVGRLADYLISRQVSRTVVRKIFQCAGTILPGIFLAILCLYPPRDAAVAIMVSLLSVS